MWKPGTHKLVYIDFSLKVAVQTHVAKDGVNVALKWRKLRCCLLVSTFCNISKTENIVTKSLFSNLKWMIEQFNFRLLFIIWQHWNQMDMCILVSFIPKQFLMNLHVLKMIKIGSLKALLVLHMSFDCSKVLVCLLCTSFVHQLFELSIFDLILMLIFLTWFVFVSPWASTPFLFHCVSK